MLGTAGHPKVLTAAGQTDRRKANTREETERPTTASTGREGEKPQGSSAHGGWDPARAALPEDGPLGGQRAGQEADGAGEKRPGFQALQKWPQRTGGARTTPRTRLGPRGQAREAASRADGART